jgi:hypothetical protein
MKRNTTKTGVVSLILGLALVSTTFMQGFKADSLTETMNEGVLGVKIAVIAGSILILFAAGCFIVASSSSEK